MDIAGYVKVLPHRRNSRRSSRSSKNSLSPPVCTLSLSSAFQDDHCLPEMKSCFEDASYEDDDWASINSADVQRLCNFDARI